jgi:hypothetical protein
MRAQRYIPRPIHDPPRCGRFIVACRCLNRKEPRNSTRPGASPGSFVARGARGSAPLRPVAPHGAGRNTAPPSAAGRPARPPAEDHGSGCNACCTLTHGGETMYRRHAAAVLMDEWHHAEREAARCFMAADWGTAWPLLTDTHERHRADPRGNHSAPSRRRAGPRVVRGGPHDQGGRPASRRVHRRASAQGPASPFARPSECSPRSGMTQRSPRR